IAQADGRARGGGRRRDRHVPALARPAWNLTDVTHASRTLQMGLGAGTGSAEVLGLMTAAGVPAGGRPWGGPEAALPGG
ncbi:hypothetical protein R0J90_23105, partial [Micrococcus sp. SIMBA_144]